MSSMKGNRHTSWSALAAKLTGSAVAALGLASALASVPSTHAAATPGGFEVVQPNSLASAMMLALIDADNVMVIDKAENNGANNAYISAGKPVWGAIMSLKDYSMRGVDMTTNPFCASGAVMGNGSWMVAGGNQGVGYGGAATNVATAAGPYADGDGRLAIRLLNPNSNAADLAWIDNAATMTSPRWYPGIEVMTDGSVLLIGGATGGGYINRNYPNVDPIYQGSGTSSLQNLYAGGANPTWEFYPSKGNAVAVNDFMVLTSGLNMYPHTFLMPSGKLFMQANYSTTLWNMYAQNESVAYTPLQDMPGQIVRVYPASAATAMLPLTPENDYTPTILFCGGTYMTDEQWGNYTSPNTNVYNVAASADCSSITPEDANGNMVNANYVHEENLPQGRTMGQFIHLPTGQMVIVNGAQKGTAGYSNTTYNTINGVNFESLSQEPTYTPVLYDPSKPVGSRLTSAGFSSSKIARLYHSSAILVPDGSVLIAGSNPHQDVSLNMPVGTTPQAFNTTYEVEKWYPPYYNEARPQPQGLPSFILFGGNTWNFSMDASYMGDSANYKAANTKIMVIRPGFSTHAMNMGQRSMRLAHTYTVNDDGSVQYMVNPMPTNQNLFVAGPALLFVTIDGVPSVGVMVQIGTQTTGGTVPLNIVAGAAPATLPAAVNNSKFTAVPNESVLDKFGLGKIIGVAVAGAAVIALLILGLCCWRRRSKRGEKKPSRSNAGAAGAIYGMGSYTSSGPEYKRVNTPTPSTFQGFVVPHRGSTGTFDTYKMNDVSGPNTPYYDHPSTMPGTPRAMTRSPLGDSQDHSYSHQGWGEHQSQGDVGEQFYRNSSYSDPARFYDNPSATIASPYSQPNLRPSGVPARQSRNISAPAPQGGEYFP